MKKFLFITVALSLSGLSYSMMRLPAGAVQAQALARLPLQLPSQSVNGKDSKISRVQMSNEQMMRALQDLEQKPVVKSRVIQPHTFYRAPVGGGFRRTMPLLMRWEHREAPHDILGVNSFASEQEIKDAYKKLALRHHPDRGGNAEMFRKATEAKNYMLENPRYQSVREGIDWDSILGNYKDFFDNFGGKVFDLFEQYVLTDEVINELFKAAALMGSTVSMDRLLKTDRVSSKTVSEAFLLSIATLQGFEISDYLLKTGKVEEKYVTAALVYVLFEQHNMYTAEYLLDKASFESQATVLAMAMQKKRLDIVEFLLPRIVNKFYKTHEAELHGLIKDYYYLLVATGIITASLVGKQIWNMYQAILTGLARRRIASELGVDRKDIQELQYDKNLKKWSYKLLGQNRIAEK